MVDCKGTRHKLLRSTRCRRGCELSYETFQKNEDSKILRPTLGHCQLRYPPRKDRNIGEEEVQSHIKRLPTPPKESINRRSIGESDEGRQHRPMSEEDDTHTSPIDDDGTRSPTLIGVFITLHLWFLRLPD